VEDLVSVADAENALEIRIKVSKTETKTMVFKGRHPVRNQILINNNIREKINTFNYLSCPISYQNEKDVTIKISIFLQITGIINRTLTLSLPN
jgi:hypothetical protein